MAANIGFLVPVKYLNNDEGYFTRLKEAADEYFYCGGERAYVLGSDDASYKAQLIECKTSSYMTALKLASVATLVIPLVMAFIKVITYFTRSVTILSPQIHQRHGSVEILTPMKKAVTFDPTAQRNHYVERFAKAGVDYNRATALQKHVAFFTTTNGNITQTSIGEGFERLHFGKIFSAIASFFVFKGLTSFTGTTDGILTLGDIHKGKHASDTGAFNERGEIDSRKIDQLRSYATINTGLLTADELMKMRSTHAKRDENVSGGWQGSIASQGEFDLTLSLFGDRFIVDEYGSLTPAITLDRLKTLYTDGPVLFEEVAAQGA